MTLRALIPALVAGAAVAALAGCGEAGGTHGLGIAAVPLVQGSTVVAQAHQCDRGADAFCALEAVIVNSQYHSSGDLVTSERQLLRQRGWSQVSPDTGLQSAAESPGHRLRLTYATALGDLQGIDLVWIHRARVIELTLSRELFARASAMSVMLEHGSS
jgi:hypothetical protein